MARQSLDADSAYADVAMHGVGLTSLQSRDAKARIRTKSNRTFPGQASILPEIRRRVYDVAAGEDGIMRMAGGSMRVPLTGQFYVGLGVCAHNWDVVETAEFNNVKTGGRTASGGAGVRRYPRNRHDSFHRPARNLRRVLR